MSAVHSNVVARVNAMYMAEKKAIWELNPDVSPTSSVVSRRSLRSCIIFAAGP